MSPRIKSVVWLLVLLVGSTLLAFAIPNAPTVQEEQAAAVPQGEWTTEDLQTLVRPGMTIEEVAEKLGQPSADIGRGIHIYVWPLKDGTELWIGYSDHIIYARHMQGQTILKNIVDEWIISNTSLGN